MTVIATGPAPTFTRAALRDLDARLLSRASAVVAMRDLADSGPRVGVIGMRHDVDHDIQHAVLLAEWEADRGYRSTYFVLHTAGYYEDKPALFEALDRIVDLGHEVGIHNDAITAALHTDEDVPPGELLRREVVALRVAGYSVVGTAGHGHELCRRLNYLNDELFVETVRRWGTVGRTIAHLGRTTRVETVARSALGLQYDAPHLPRSYYLSDSGGVWAGTVSAAAAALETGCVHVLQHPCWWPL